jgi:hypothetical protein
MIGPECARVAGGAWQGCLEMTPVKSVAQEAFEECYDHFAEGVPMPPELERSMLFWAEKSNQRYTLLLFGVPGETVSGGVLDADTHLVIRHDGERVPLHLFLYATGLPLLAMFTAGVRDDA